MEYHNFTATGDVNGPVLAAVLAVEAVVAFIANIIVLSITLYQRKSWKQSSTIFFTSLILSNLLAVVGYLPMNIVAIGAEEWIFGSTFEERSITCLISALIIQLNIAVTTEILAAISFDRCLFVVKPHLHKRFMRPWVALTLTIAIWIFCILLLMLPLLGFGKYSYEFSYGPCIPMLIKSPVYSFVHAALHIISFAVIIITSIWTCCFTQRFINDQSEIVGDNSVYASRKKKLFGIFGSMFLAYSFCYGPSYITLMLYPVVEIDEIVYAADMVTFQFITVASPLIQAYFRPDIKNALIWFKKSIVSQIGKRLYSPPQNEQ
uniref:G-protein coupled receptors family 1 profile domain-containing protein n=1 Tax=Amphimedon queenslandica TaxID=400682 RepID=A0A1X7TU75_AMPQE